MRISDWSSDVCSSDLTMRTVADRNTVGRAHTAETPALHRTGKALTLGHALDVDDLAGDEMVGRQFGADVERRVVGDAEFDELRLGLDFGLAISAALRDRKSTRLNSSH